MSNTPQTNGKLVRGLGLLDAFSLVAGSMIGTGVFLKAATMTQTVGSSTYVLLAWVVSGLLSLTGALVYAEIGSIYPHAGGEYVYMREGYGKFSGYLYGWTRFWIASPATIAAYSVGAATFLSGAISLDFFGGIVGTAILFIVVFTTINCFAIQVGGRVQSFFTLLKVALIVGLSLLIFFSGKGSFTYFQDKVGGFEGFPGISAFGVAMLASLWAYDGWNNLPMVAGEVKNPQKNIPLALIFGLIAVLVVYGLINLAYFYILPLTDIVSANSNANPSALPVATLAAKAVMGPTVVSILSVMFVISALGAMNGSIMTSARVPYAMAEDGVFIPQLKNIHSSSSVPVISILVQGLISSVFAMLGNFDQLTDYVVFSSWIFYGLIMASIFKLRKKHGHNHSGYKAWGYPVVPLIFMAVATFLLVNTLITSPENSLIGLGIIACGVPFYFLFLKLNAKKV